jgi:hypothetical protein
LREESGLQESRGNPVVTVKLNVIKRSSDSIPSRGCSGFTAMDVGAGGEDYIAVSHRLTHQNDLDFERSSYRERSRAEEVDSGRTDIASNQGHRKIFGNVVHASESQRKLESSARILALLRNHTDSVRRNADEATRISFGRNAKKAQLRRGGAWRTRKNMRSGGKRRPQA